MINSWVVEFWPDSGGRRRALRRFRSREDAARFVKRARRGYRMSKLQGESSWVGECGYGTGILAISPDKPFVRRERDGSH